MDQKTLKFTKTHEWISDDGTVGISDHAQKEITDVVFIEFPTVETHLAQAAEAGTIESVKAAFPIYAPVSGKVSATNDTIGDHPGLVNQSPYEKGWIYKLEISNLDELKNLMSYEEYQDFLKSETEGH